MVTNKNALTRYKHLDKMLPERQHLYGIHNRIFSNNPYIQNSNNIFVFDMDNTLIETNKANYLAYYEAIGSVLRGG